MEQEFLDVVVLDELLRSEEVLESAVGKLVSAVCVLLQ